MSLAGRVREKERERERERVREKEREKKGDIGVWRWSQVGEHVWLKGIVEGI